MDWFLYTTASGMKWLSAILRKNPSQKKRKVRNKDHKSVPAFTLHAFLLLKAVSSFYFAAF